LQYTAYPGVTMTVHSLAQAGSIVDELDTEFSELPRWLIEAHTLEAVDHLRGSIAPQAMPEMARRLAEVRLRSVLENRQRAS
jgi:hypothetical protein